MKYFVRSRGRKPILVDRNTALSFYRLAVNGGTFAMMNAIESLARGQYCSSISYDIWGERITDKECFERILKGQIQNNNKDIYEIFYSQ